MRDLRLESAGALRGARLCFAASSDGTEGRGGNPARCYLQASGGQAQDVLYLAAEVAGWLTELCGAPVTPTGERGTYSYYVRQGDYLALHRDVEACDVAVITCVYESALNAGGVLCVYPDRIHEPLSAIRAAPERGMVPVPLRPGQTVVMLGGIVPHHVLPMAQGQVRIVSVLCYRALAELPHGNPCRAAYPRKERLEFCSGP